jgi:hypothetical protein
MIGSIVNRVIACLCHWRYNLHIIVIILIITYAQAVNHCITMISIQTGDVYYEVIHLCPQSIDVVRIEFKQIMTAYAAGEIVGEIFILDLQVDHLN